MDRDVLEVAKQLMKKSSAVTEIYNLTIQLQDCVDRNDSKTIKLVMNMRSEAILATEPIDIELKRLVDALPDDKRDDIKSQMTKHYKIEESNAKEHRVHEIHMGIQATLKKTIDINDRMNQKFQMAANKKTKSLAEQRSTNTGKLAGNSGGLDINVDVNAQVKNSGADLGGYNTSTKSVGRIQPKKVPVSIDTDWEYNNMGAKYGNRGLGFGSRG